MFAAIEHFSVRVFFALLARVLVPTVLDHGPVLVGGQFPANRADWAAHLSRMGAPPVVDSTEQLLTVHSEQREIAAVAFQAQRALKNAENPEGHYYEFHFVI